MTKDQMTAIWRTGGVKYPCHLIAWTVNGPKRGRPMNPTEQKKEETQMTYETTHTFKTARFTVRLAVAPEPGSPAWFGAEEDIIRIERGELQYFVARVTVECDGRLLASDYLGGCCYESVDQFRRDNYYFDMVRTACRQARRALANPPRMRAVA